MHILEGVLDKLNFDYQSLDLRLNEVMPKTRLIQSALYAGGNEGLSLDTELKKKILSANRQDHNLNTSLPFKHL